LFLAIFLPLMAKVSQLAGGVQKIMPVFFANKLFFVGITTLPSCNSEMTGPVCTGIAKLA
jgi:hypothetical protein